MTRKLQLVIELFNVTDRHCGECEYLQQVRRNAECTLFQMDLNAPREAPQRLQKCIESERDPLEGAFD